METIDCDKCGQVMMKKPKKPKGSVGEPVVSTDTASFSPAHITHVGTTVSSVSGCPNPIENDQVPRMVLRTFTCPDCNNETQIRVP